MSTIPVKILNYFDNLTLFDSLTISRWTEEWDKLTYEEKYSNSILWDKISFEQRLYMVKLDCAAINELPYIKELGIISTPYLLNFRFMIKKEKINKNSLKIAIYFHGDPDKSFDINDISGIGNCPVCYGTVKNKEKINGLKSQLYQLQSYFA